MKSILYFLIIGFIMISLFTAGCGVQKAKSSHAAITTARKIVDVVKRTNYLVSQAKAFYNSKDFKSTIDISLYILDYIDENSHVAKDLLKRSNSALKAQSRLQATDIIDRLEYQTKGSK